MTDQSGQKEKATQGVRILRGDPKKAIVKISGSMVIATLVQWLYNLVDGVWVAGLGEDALSAIGLFFPVFMIIISLAGGIGIGGSSTISRKIGAKNKALADSTAIHSLILGCVLSVVLYLTIFPSLGKILTLIGAEGKVFELSFSYGRILIGGLAVFILTNITNGILQGEGDARRAMYAMVTGSILNIILDPIFIYLLDMGIEGAAWATLASITVSAGLMSYWIFVQRNTYTSVDLRQFNPDLTLIKEILRVGLPTSFAHLSMAIATLILNIVVIKTGGSEGIAVFTSAWRVIMIGIVPLLGIAAGVTAVSGAAYGQKDAEKLESGYLYAIKIGFIAEILIATIVISLAPILTRLFTYSEDTIHIADKITTAMRILVLFLPAAPFGMLTSAMFQGIGRGEYALATTILRTIIMQLLFSYILGIYLGFGIKGVWIGIVLGNVNTAIIAFTWGRLTIKRLRLAFARDSLGKNLA